jgi:ABC-type Fe3+/spermidine/putrescine transport system ATPase subunit
MAAPLLRLEDVSKRFGDTVAADRVTLGVDRGEFFTFLGSSGSGKSTLLRIIAGLERPDAGRVVIDGRDVDGVPPWRRHLGMVFQQYAVFPHMTVAENVAYGLRVRRAPAARARARVRDLLRLVNLEGTDDRDVTRLSGGEQQRVALARALAPEPSLLLLDEPLGALDEKIRREMQGELKRIQRETGTTFLYVTHDQEEALTMSDRVAVMHRGACVQVDAPEALLRRPRTRFTASFFRGSNVLEADVLETAPGRAVLAVGGQPIPVTIDRPLPTGRRAAVTIRAEDVRIGSDLQPGHVRLDGVLVDVVYRGTSVDHVLELPDRQRLVATSTHRETDGVGRPIAVGVDPARVVVLED